MDARQRGLPAESLAVARVRPVFAAFAALVQRFNEAELVAQSAALAFFALLSLAPLLLILLWITAAALPSAREAFLDQVGLLLGHDFGTVADAILTSAVAKPVTGSIAGLWSGALLLFAATAVFGQLQSVLNHIFRTSAKRLPGIVAWLRKRIFSFGMVLALGFLLVVSMTVNTLLQLAFARIAWLLPMVAAIVTWLIYALAFALMFHYLPDRRVGWRWALVGGVLTASLFVLGRAVIGWYLERWNPGAAYGAMGALVLTLLWVYYAGLIVFIGALVTAMIDERVSRNARIKPA
jgi:membrane protein